MPEPAAPPATATARAGHRAWAVAAFVAGIVVLGFNLRTAISALAATPVLCFAVFSGVAAPLSRRYGEERVLLAALALLGAGLLARAAVPGWLLFPGTVLAAAAIAVMNVLLPSLVKRRRPARAGVLIGI